MFEPCTMYDMSHKNIGTTKWHKETRPPPPYLIFWEDAWSKNGLPAKAACKPNREFASRPTPPPHLGPPSPLPPTPHTRPIKCRQVLTRKLPTYLTSWDGTISSTSSSSSSSSPSAAATEGLGDEQEPLSWRVNYLRLHARTLIAREAKNLTNRVPDVRRLGVPRGRDPLSLEEMWEMARVESFAPGDEVVFLRCPKIKSFFFFVGADGLGGGGGGGVHMPRSHRWLTLCSNNDGGTEC